MLENCPNISSVNFSGCDGYTRNEYGNRKKVSEGIYGMLFCECSFVFGVPVRNSSRNFSSQNLARIFSSGSQNLQKIPGISSLHSTSFTHSHLPCLLVNPIPHYTGDIKVLGNCTQLKTVIMYNTNVQGTTELSSSSCRPVRFFGRNFSSKNLARIFSSGL